MGHFRRRLSFVWICCLACIIRIIVGQQCDEETIELQHNLFWSLKKLGEKKVEKVLLALLPNWYLITLPFTLISPSMLLVMVASFQLQEIQVICIFAKYGCKHTILCTIPIPMYTIPIGCNPIRFVLNIAAGVHIHCTFCYSNLKRNDKNKSSKKIWWVRMAKFFKENSRKPKIYRRLSGACTSLVSRQMLPMLRILAGFED